ncbi:hypothetical protein ABZ845_28420 [Streptomyces sp. NPDC047022]|uniref:hypothetical protein n=1 Tax=Streptomyces sp. NPDC047022 TaxID=3155737 RepID=UPI0034026175
MFAQFIEGLPAELPKKNGWTLPERAGHVTADGMQWLLNGSVWDADRLRDAVRDYVITHLGCADASLVIDDTQAQRQPTQPLRTCSRMTALPEYGDDTPRGGYLPCVPTPRCQPASLGLARFTDPAYWK